MAGRRSLYGSRPAEPAPTPTPPPPPLPADGAVTEMDAVRLARRMDVDVDVHTLLTRQHVTSHVRDHTTESNRTARKSGVRRVTTRVVRATTTITRGEQRTLSDNLLTSTDRSHGYGRDASLYGEQGVAAAAAPAIEYRPQSAERSNKKAKVMRLSVD